MFLLRAFFISIPRFLVFMALAVFTLRFEVSPLPDWTLIAFVYFLHFGVTYACTRWTFKRRLPSERDIALVAAAFVVLETAYEASVSLAYAPSLRSLIANYSWQSLYLVLLYVAAAWLAGWDVRRKKILQAMPEGMEG